MIENGHRNPSVINLLFIARALRVHPGRLFEDLNDRDMARLPKKRARRLRTGK
jgi:transcriptional regulator with XRE-family HTH domain